MPLLETLLPRHMQIIYEINARFLAQVAARWPADTDRLRRMSIIEDGANGEKSVRMAYLAVVASHTVNGVAAIHSEIVKDDVFNDFYKLWPHKFQNKTNGVTPRRWLAFCNPALSAVITKTLGTDGWIADADLLAGLRAKADDPTLQAAWAAAKLENKQRVADYAAKTLGLKLNTSALFDIQIKRIHEYKRQVRGLRGARGEGEERERVQGGYE